MIVTLHPDANTARLSALLAFMDLGTGVCRVRIYGGVMAASPTNAPGTPLLVEMLLLKPSATIAGGVMTLHADVPQMNAETGAATWARIVNGNGDTVLDCDVSDTEGAGAVKIGSTTLYANGETKMLSGVFG